MPLEYKVVNINETQKLEESKFLETVSNAHKTISINTNTNIKGSSILQNKDNKADKEKEDIFISPSNICFDENLPNFSKWMSSIMQSIKDLNILKIESIIYPQKNGIPIYNPAGRYWLKLFHMGKYRKIEIDDRMPCTKFEEFIFPYCENIEEIWPALITKGILKLNSYKNVKIKYKQENILQEKSDIGIFYTLTGFVPEHLNINYLQEGKFKQK
jgi:hypothetical protein